MSVKRYSVWEDEVFDEKHALNPKNSMVHLMVMHEDYAAIEARCAALAAENAGLKAEHELALQYMDELRANFTMYKKFKCHSQSNVTTPATDAFLAEVRAQGVEAFASVLEARGKHHEYVEIANAYAAQLRKGVQS